MSLDFSSDIQMVRSEFGINMKAWIHPVLYQWFRLVAGGVMVWWIHPASYQWFRLVVSWCGGSIPPRINGSGWWCHGVVDPSHLVSMVQAGGVMVWWIHPASYQWFRLVVVVSWCGGSIPPRINGSGWWWCHGVVVPSRLVSMVQAGGVMVWWFHPASYQWFRLVVVSWCGGSIPPRISGSGWWWCHGVVDPSRLISVVQAGGGVMGVGNIFLAHIGPLS
ncbi:unnamed protein product, partial [Staurois parvus]